MAQAVECGCVIGIFEGKAAKNPGAFAQIDTMNMQALTEALGTVIGAAAYLAEAASRDSGRGAESHARARSPECAGDHDAVGLVCLREPEEKGLRAGSRRQH